MTKITENTIEEFSIELLKQLGWSYANGPDLAPDGETPERDSYETVILKARFQNALTKLNPHISNDALQQAIKEIERIASPGLIVNNEQFYRLLCDGIPVQYHQDGVEKNDYVWMIDFKNPANNDYLAVNQFTVIENNINKRSDIVLFVNGLPLVVIELKNAGDENATIRNAFDQIKTYQATIPSLFTFNAFNVVSDGHEARAGSLSAGFTRYLAWKTADGRSEASTLVNQLETLLNGLFSKQTFIDYIRHFVVFEKTSHTDAKGVTTVQTEKKIAAYHQYYAVNKAIESVIRATGLDIGKNFHEPPESYGLPSVKKQPSGDKKGGVVWHTQGSGKSLTMVFFTGKIVLQLNNPTIVVITDRNDLDDQLFDTFGASTQLLRQTPIQAENSNHLKELLKVGSGGIVFTTVQKFFPDNGNVYEKLSERKNIVVIADEAHRTQYGFRPKSVNTSEGGNKIVYGFAKYMRDALPNATYIGFTGTPIEHTDKNTPAVFGNYIDIYDIAHAVEDGATVKMFYESRLAKVNLSEEGKQLLEQMDKELESEELSTTQRAKAKWSKLEAIVGSEERIKNIAKDIVQHFETRQQAFEGKAMIVAMSRRIAVDLYNEIIKIKPGWHAPELDKGVIKVVMTGDKSSDGPEMQKHHTTKQQRRALGDRMKDPDDPLKMVIVRDMWLTGFDVPSLHTMYIDKPMKGHTLMQAIARVNRVYKDKPGGLIVDYLGIASDLKKALSFYAESGGKGDPAIAQEQAVNMMLEKIEVISQMFHGFPYEKYFDADTRGKLNTILEAEEHILSLDNGKERFMKEVAALSQAFAIALPHDTAMDVKEEVAFFQAVKSRLVKFEPSQKGRSSYEIETAIRQVVDEAIVSEKVVDVFDAAGIKKPDISILSDDFMQEIKGMKHKNLAMEVLRKILNDEIKARAKRNMVQSRSLMEMLETSIKKYQNKVLSAAEVIQELIDLAEEIRKADERGDHLGMSEDEMAFYDALSANKSAIDVLGDETLRELAHVLVDRVRKNATIDWTIKESVRAKLKVIVKRTLRQYGYPPDKQAIATETVLKQAALYADSWVFKY